MVRTTARDLGADDPFAAAVAAGIHRLAIPRRSRLRRFAAVYVGGEDIRFLEGLDTPVEGGDEVTILPAAAAG